jgi:hypothetical protein
MDTMKLLLGATVALLLGALVMSWQGMNRGVENAPADEIARLRKQISELRAEQDRVQLEKQIQQIKASTPEMPATSHAEIDAMRAQLAAQQAALAGIEAEKEKERAARDSRLAQDEEGLLSQRDLEKGDSELRRARMIAEALLIGRVQEVVEDAEVGGFITFQILMPEQVQPGSVLAIRRKTGILGQLSVTDITPEGGIANPLPGFGPVQPQAGDELILPPPF